MADTMADTMAAIVSENSSRASGLTQESLLKVEKLCPISFAIFSFLSSNDKISELRSFKICIFKCIPTWDSQVGHLIKVHSITLTGQILNFEPKLILMILENKRRFHFIQIIHVGFFLQIEA